MERIVLERKKMVSQTLISKDVFASKELIVAQTGENFLHKELTAQLEAFVLSSQCQTQMVYHYAEKPTFWDWFHGRRKKIAIEIKAEDLMIKPPKMDSARTYEVEILWIEDTNK